jgi:hypothetical protein
MGERKIFDRNDNPIGDGKYHVNYYVEDFSDYPQIETNVSFSDTTESVYVNYYNNSNGESITTRFSNHENNAVKFGYQLNGYLTSKLEILYKLGLAERIFIKNPPTKTIHKKQVKIKDVPNYEQSSLTIQQMYDLDFDSDLSKHKGKIAKGSNWLILGDKVESLDSEYGHYEYKEKLYAKGGYVSYKNKYNAKYGYSESESHSLEQISKDTGVSMKGLQQIYNKGIGAYKTNPTSVRPNVKSKEQWAMARVYSAVMGGKASKIDSNELKMAKGGLIAPNGKKSNLTALQYKLVRTKAFKDWFGDWENDPENASKVVDENGEPKVVYHGAEVPNGLFYIFRSGSYFTDTYNSARYYSLKLAYGIEDVKEENTTIYECFLSIKNPKTFDYKNEDAEILFHDFDENDKRIKEYESNGYNGIIWEYDYVMYDFRSSMSETDYNNLIKTWENNPLKKKQDIDDFWKLTETKKENHFIIFNPNQIKLADGSNTTFDSNNLDIRFDGGGSVHFGEKTEFYERTYADGTKERFSIEDYEKNIYPLLEKEMKNRKFNGGGNINDNDMEEYNDLKKNIEQSIVEYELNKKKLQKDNLFNAIADGFKFIQESDAFNPNNANYKKDYQEQIRTQLFPLVIEAQSYLPRNSKYVIGDIDYGYTEFIKFLPKSYFDFLPSKSIKNIKVKTLLEKPYPINYTNENLQKIFSQWIGDDDLRLKLQGIYFDKYGATGTDAHKLLHLVGEKPKDYKEDVIYKGTDIIDEKFPNYRQVSNILLDEILTPIDCQIMLNALETLIDSACLNLVTHQIVIKKGDRHIGLNAEFLVINFRTWLQLGVSKVNFWNKQDEYTYSKQAILFTDANESLVAQDGMSYTLIMPVMLLKETFSTYIDIIDENNIDVVVENSPAYRFSSSAKSNNKEVNKFVSEKEETQRIINDLRETLPFLSEEEKASTKELIVDLRLLIKFMDDNTKFNVGGRPLTRQEVESMQRVINDPLISSKLKESFKKVLESRKVPENADLSRFPEGKYIDLYDFSGYDYMKSRNEEMGVSFLLTGEYELVSKAIFEKDYAMWLFYNYLGRVNISFANCQLWLKEAQASFINEMPIQIGLTHQPKAKDGRSYAMWYTCNESKKVISESRLGVKLTFEYNGRWYCNEIGMVGNYDYKGTGWGTFYEEKKTGLLLPEYTETSFHLNTLIHEFAHCYDFQSQLLSNIQKYKDKKFKEENEEVDINTEEMTELEKQLYGNSLNEEPLSVSNPITNHFEFFIDSLIRVLRQCASGKIPLTQKFEQQSLDVQTALQGTYGDLLLAQREKRRKDAIATQKMDEMRDNTRFTWQGKIIGEFMKYAEKNTIQKGILESLSKRGVQRNFNLSEIIELDNLISNYAKTEFLSFATKNPSKSQALYNDLKDLKVETNRIINNHYDNIRRDYEYGFYPNTDLDKYLQTNCDVKDFRDYKSWKECNQSKLKTQTIR